MRVNHRFHFREMLNESARNHEIERAFVARQKAFRKEVGANDIVGIETILAEHCAVQIRTRFRIFDAIRFVAKRLVQPD